MTEAPASPPAEARHLVLPFVAVWRRTRMTMYYALVVVVIAIGFNYLSHHGLEVAFVVLGAALLVLAIGLQFGAGRHYVVVEPEGLRISGLVRSALIPFEAIVQLRVQPVEALFDTPSRRLRLARALQAFRRTPACLLRLDLEPSYVYRLGRLLGRGSAVDQDLILVVEEVEELASSLRQRVRDRPPPRTLKRGRR